MKVENFLVSFYELMRTDLLGESRMEIVFTDIDPCMDGFDVALQVKIDGPPFSCKITAEALQNLSEVASNNSVDLINAAKQNRYYIEDAFRRKYDGNEHPFVLNSVDFA